ncbi:MAG: RHO1 GDP-GTP exchange protein 2 [Cirrosporium novae-zelandiae]|nr:MAG: RHO1 GDP-GTP exchange protein 2 [Cirrosporium novae-zelandiae]
MTEYSTQPGRIYRPNGHASSIQRDAAFSDIFGSAPPPGRSQTMTSQSPHMIPGRTQTMTSQPTNDPSMQRPAPMRHPQTYGPPNNYPQQQNRFNPAPQRVPNGYPPPQHQQPPPNRLPQPVYPDRRPYPQAQRIDPRQSLQQQVLQKQPPQRGQGQDNFRSYSLASTPRPMYQGPPPNTYNNASAASFRQQPYHSMASRTTAQGRIVPERHDERAMSMSSYSVDRDHNQTMSGRVIPNRYRESQGSQPFDPRVPEPVPPSVAQSTTGSMRTASITSSRTMSMASTIMLSPSERTDSMKQQPSLHKSNSSSTTIATTQRKKPIVYPALLSRVAEIFATRMTVGDRTKNDLTYKSGFTGAEAVDLIAYIIKTNDRNLALLLGRSLDAQKFFHDVTYDHRLRDSPHEVYQFRNAMGEEASDRSSEVNGVFTLLTECYSPTCSPSQLCYSIACPRRLEQQARLNNLKPQPVLKRVESRSSLHDGDSDEQKLWINSVPKEVAEKVGDKEKKRQEVISELMYTERDFVKDLEYLRDFWMKPLRSNNSPIPEHRREMFVRTVFSNCIDVLGVNSKFAESLTRRQQEDPVVKNVGDIFLQYVPKFHPFIQYGANQLYGKWQFEKERAANPAFTRFVDETERLKESRKLELNGYLTKPTTRLARYPLLLENVLKHTADDNPDKEDIPKAVAIIRDFLGKVNIESGKAENHFNLMQLNQNLKWSPGEEVDLKLEDDNRQLIFKTVLKKSDNAEVTCYVLDHAILLVRVKTINKKEEIKVYRRPIPLELLIILQMEEIIPKAGITKRPTIPKAATNNASAKEGHPITFRHIGKRGYEVTLFATSHVARRKLMEHIEAQQSKLKERSNIYSQTILSEGFFTIINRLNCLCPIDGGRKLVYGTDNGIYVSDRKPHEQLSKPRQVLEIGQVTQVDALEEYQILLVIANKTLYTYSMEALLESSSDSLLKRPRKIQSHTNFFKTGFSSGRHLVCCVKNSTSTTVKVYEPTEQAPRANRRPAFARMFQGGQETLKLFKEFYIPVESSSLHFLRSKLCVGCARGFEVVSLETLETQSLLDAADTSLDFVAEKGHIKPVHIERLNDVGEFLLNYSDFSFFVNRHGWRARPDWRIMWEGQPQAFALSDPYILAFEPSFIEIRHIETSSMVHILTAKNIRMLHASTREILYAYEDDNGDDVVISLDFWSKKQSD